MSFSATSFPTLNFDQPLIDFVQLDSLVVMKIVKHGDIEFYAGMSKVAGETCQGILTGLISIEEKEKKLEITNCFSTSRPDILADGDDGSPHDPAAYQDTKDTEVIEMLKRFRMMNIDYELVGFYQAHPFGVCFNIDMFFSLVDYQSSQQNAVVLIYDPIRTRQGNLTIRAYRLSRKALELANIGDWSPEVTKQAGLNFSNFFEELPIVVKNSHLINVLLAELALSSRGKKTNTVVLELGTKRALERSVKASMGTVDELNKAVNAYGRYMTEKQKYDAIYASMMQKRAVENEARLARGEPPISIEEIKKQIKQPQMQTKNGMLDLFLGALDANAYASFQIAAANENMTKLHLSQALCNQQMSGSGVGVPSLSSLGGSSSERR
uniref:MPN domain-containing protein n=1 Tax=Meloidogyne enterolobii TaxID=390850 RepID=A0A6V7X0D7_MELEN|nr:unnamed protein product [Meloidogyne enterolobii]CAD2203635.1 unnamed protein product [Meloidogyne enterolobii]